MDLLLIPHSASVPHLSRLLHLLKKFAVTFQNCALFCQECDSEVGHLEVRENSSPYGFDFLFSDLGVFVGKLSAQFQLNDPWFGWLGVPPFIRLLLIFAK